MTVNRERQKIEVQVTTLDLDYLTLAQVAEQINNLITTYGADAKVSWHTERWDSSERYHVMVKQDETDEQMARRIAGEERIAAQVAERERAEFERLKAKFDQS